MNSAVRDQVYRATRDFFSGAGYQEVQTPVRIPVPAQELHIDAIRSGDQYLRTSPEFHMKRLLVDGMERIFQIGPCFRAGEKGALHNPEFTMLEWYHVGADYMETLEETKSLIQCLASKIDDRATIERGDLSIDLSGSWDERDVSKCFLEHAGWDPVQEYDPDRFDLDLVNRVEPALSKDRPVFLKDYPVEAAAFSAIRDSAPPVAERWELYIAGVELANAYTELTDPVEQRLRLETIAAQRMALGKEVYPQDEEFLLAMDRGLPSCSGVALGMDRLVMLLTGADTIADVLQEPMSL